MKLLKSICAVLLSVLCLAQGMTGLAAFTATGGDSLETILNRRSPVEEPYDYISGGSISGDPVAASPDPLIQYRWDTTSGSDALQIFCMQPALAETDTPESFAGLETLTGDSPDLTVSAPGTIQLDFGTELAGWLEIDSPDLDGQITLGISEYNAPAFVNSGPQSPSKTAVPVQYGNTYRLELNSELYEGVRFGFINVTQVNQPFHITGVRVVCQVKPTNYNSSFDCDNALLNQIWYTAAYDVRVNLKQDYFAAILMDRGDRHSWTGDAYTAQAASLVAFGNYDFVLDNLRYTAQRSNGIESYELYWVESLIDYYQYSGDREGVRSLLPQATSRLDHAYEIYGKNPNLSFYGWDERLGAGFENPNNPETQQAYQMVAIGAWKHFAAVLGDLGETQLAKKYQGYAAEKTEALAADADWWQSFGIHANSDAINAGVFTQDQIEGVIETYYTDRVNRLSYSPFNQYFILEAMGDVGCYEEAIISILDLWGGQVEYGGTTFFETYRPSWNDVLEENDPVPNNQAGYTSLAHPWSAGVLSWMSEEILGIKPIQAGFRSFSVTPHLGSQLTRVSGDTFTPYGTVTVSLDTETGLCTVTVPEGTACDYAIPKAGKDILTVLMNGRRVNPDGEDAGYVYFTGLTPGNYEFSITYAGETPAYTPETITWPATVLGQEQVTAGNWGDRYGADGYLLCDYRGSDLSNLPDYVASVTTNKVQHQAWVNDTADPRALAENPYGIGSRNLGVWYSWNNVACNQTFTVDVTLKEQREYTVALYFVDWDQQDRVQAVELFDLKTLNLIAPVQLIRDFSGGAYLVFQYHDSVRFRIDQVRGDNAVLSGIFFGTPGETFSGEEGQTAIAVDDQDSAVSYTGSWTHDPMSGAYANTFSYSNQVGNTASYTFTGTGITFLSSLESNRGIAEIFLDGVSQGKVDLYAATTARQQPVFQAQDLPLEQHILQVAVTGEQNPAATGAYVDVDAFLVTAPRIYTLEEVAEALHLLPLASAEPQVRYSPVPPNFAVTLVDSDHLDIVALDGNVTLPEKATDVTLTLQLSGAGETIQKVLTIQVPAEPEHVTLLPGDLNGDGALSVTDVVLLRKAILANTAVADVPAGDLNGDSALTVTDVVLLRKAILAAGS